jgi:hypothetical protein
MQPDRCSWRLFSAAVGSSRTFYNAQNATAAFLSGLRRSSSIALSLVISVALL